MLATLNLIKGPWPEFIGISIVQEFASLEDVTAPNAMSLLQLVDVELVYT